MEYKFSSNRRPKKLRCVPGDCILACNGDVLFIMVLYKAIGSKTVNETILAGTNENLLHSSGQPMRSLENTTRITTSYDHTFTRALF